MRRPPRPTLFPYTTLFRSGPTRAAARIEWSKAWARDFMARRSEEHTSELQSQSNLVCRLLLEKKKGRRVARQEEHAVGDLLPRPHPPQGFAGRAVGAERLEPTQTLVAGHASGVHDVGPHALRPSFFYSCADHRDLHSFPTRRSSDLVRPGLRHASSGARRGRVTLWP